jgi:hypothetical protein
MAAGKEGKDSCNGDSGGPAYIKLDGKLLLAGVTSRGSEVCGLYGIYTRPEAALDWIIANTRAYGGIVGSETVVGPGPGPCPCPATELVRPGHGPEIENRLAWWSQSAHKHYVPAALPARSTRASPTVTERLVDFDRADDPGVTYYRVSSSSTPTYSTTRSVTSYSTSLFDEPLVTMRSSASLFDAPLLSTRYVSPYSGSLFDSAWGTPTYVRGSPLGLRYTYTPAYRYTPGYVSPSLYGSFYTAPRYSRGLYYGPRGFYAYP